jgi:hypothetical protein
MTEPYDSVTRLENNIGKRTDARVDALTAVRARRVTYRPRAAEWSLSGEAVGGWDFRTLTSLRQAGALVVGNPNKEGVSTVELSESGEGLLVRWLD